MLGILIKNLKKKKKNGGEHTFKNATVTKGIDDSGPNCGGEI